jgi:hypothetical protein
MKQEHSVNRLLSTWRGPAVAFGLGVALACLALAASTGA